MSSRGFVVRVASAVLVAGAAFGISAGTASAWPIPITPEQQRFINQARAAGFPGDDDAVLQAGLRACQLLMTGSGTQGATDGIVGETGADPGPAAALVRRAHGILCTSARG
ncbi:hypothetical protein A7G45_13365 [Mycolicibacterium llatzerense]|nr:hypothetical protein [Mycolicibacterium llatzerense]MCT7367949.1 hypothetical protein [Mycolicibacterium llatzerense]